MNAPIVIRWTAEEDAVIRAHYPTGSVAACRPHLGPHRSDGGIVQRAGKLGLKGPGRARHMTGRPAAELDAEIRARFATHQSGKSKVAALADELGVPRWWLSRRLLKLGLATPQSKEPPWTPAEEALLETMPLHNPQRCVKLFAARGYKRTAAAIVIRARRLELSRKTTHEGMAAGRAAEIIGIDGKTMGQWCAEGRLAAGRAEDARTAQQGGHRWEITPGELRRFVVDNPERVDFARADKLALIALLAGPAAAAEAPPAPERRQSPEPGWTAEKLDKARRLFGKVMIEIAFALNVPPKELLDYGLNGVVPPAIRKPARAPRGSRKLQPALLMLPAPAAEAVAPKPPKRNGRPPRAWPAERLAELRRRAEAGESSADIGKALGLGSSSIRHACRTHGIALLQHKGEPWTAARLETLRAMAAEGLSQDEAAERLGVTRPSLSMAAHRHDIGFTRPPSSAWSAERLEALRRHAAAGLSQREAAERLGVSLSAVASIASLKAIRFPAKGRRTKPRPAAAAVAAVVADAAPALPAMQQAPAAPRRPAAASPAGQRYRLEASPGLYLHQDCFERVATTADVRWAWGPGTKKQIDALRAKFPELKTFTAREIYAAPPLTIGDRMPRGWAGVLA